MPTNGHPPSAPSVAQLPPAQLPVRMPIENELPPLCQADLADARRVFPYLDTGCFAIGWLARESLAWRNNAAVLENARAAKSTAVAPPASSATCGVCQSSLGVCECGG